jgi:hypothetical protein
VVAPDEKQAIETAILEHRISDPDTAGLTER